MSGAQQDRLAANFESSVLARRAQEQAEARAYRSRLERAEREGPEALERLAEYESGVAAASCQRYGKWNTGNFQPLKVLGQGGFGTVTLVRHKVTQEVFALKSMPKARLEDKNKRHVAFRERDAMNKVRGLWTVELHATFQDSKHIYFVMEFAQGGDFITLLNAKGRLSNEETRFYMGELVEAVDAVHQCSLAHRDIKPENIVLTAQGHLKLLDFGVCKTAEKFVPRGPFSRSFADCLTDYNLQASADHHPRARSVAGTLEYMAPESFDGEAGQPADLWAVGAITFQCLAGRPALWMPPEIDAKDFAGAVKEAILRHEEYVPMILEALEKFGCSAAALSFIAQTLTSQERRLTADGMRCHAFFDGVDFRHLHTMRPPIVPKVSSDDDTTNFGDFKDYPATLPGPESRLTWDKTLDWANVAQDSREAEAERRYQV